MLSEQNGIHEHSRMNDPRKLFTYAAVFVFIFDLLDDDGLIVQGHDCANRCFILMIHGLRLLHDQSDVGIGEIDPSAFALDGISVTEEIGQKIDL